MANRDTFTTEIYVNQDQANDAMEKLREKVKETSKAYEKLLNTKDADTAKTEKARKAWEAATQSLERAETGVAEYDRALKNLSGQSMNRLLRMQQQINSELKKTKPGTAEWKKLADQYAQVTNRVKDLRAAQDKITLQSKGFKGVLESVSAAGNKFGMAIMAIPTAIKPFAAALKGVVSVTKEVISASQTMSDKWNNGIAAMKTTTDAFFMALSSGNWDAFNDGISGALKKARELAELKDVLGDFQLSQGVVYSTYMADFAEQRNVATSNEEDEKTRKEALDNMKKDIEQYNEFIARKGEKTWETLQKSLDAWKGLTFETADDMKSFLTRYFEFATTGFDEEAESLIKVKKELDSAQSRYNAYNSVSVTSEGPSYAASHPEEQAADLDKLIKARNAYNDALAASSSETKAIVAALELNDEKRKELANTYIDYMEAVRSVAAADRSLQKTEKQVLNEIAKNVEDAAKKEAEAKKKAAEDRVKAREDAYNRELSIIDKNEKNQLIVIKQQYANGLMDKERYEAEKTRIQADYLKARYDLTVKYGKDGTAYLNQILDQQIKSIEYVKSMLKDEAAEVEEYNNETPSSYSGAVQGENNGINDQQAYDDFQEAIWQKAADIRKSITEQNDFEIYEAEMKWAEKLAEDGKITAEEAEKYKYQIRLKYGQKAAQAAIDMADKVANAVAAFKDMELAKAEATYQAELTAAGDNAAAREQAEQNYNQKKLEITKKYANVEMTINIAKAIASGALAIMQAFAQLGPIGGAIAAVLVAATTAAEVATIVQQRNAIMAQTLESSGGSSQPVGQRTLTGYSEGGYTGRRSSDSAEVGVVHANEWVAPAWMVRRNPVQFANLERYRLAGSHGRSGSRASGFAEGGFTDAAEAGQTTYGGQQLLTEATGQLILAAVQRDTRAWVALSDLEAKQKQKAKFKAATGK